MVKCTYGKKIRNFEYIFYLVNFNLENASKIIVNSFCMKIYEFFLG